MSSDTHNTKTGKHHFGSSGDNMRRQKEDERDPNKNNARDREGRKGGSNEENL